MDLTRLYMQGFIGWGCAIIVLWVLAFIVIKFAPHFMEEADDDAVKALKKYVNLSAFVVTLIMLLSGVIFTIKSVSLNATPRGDLDRSAVHSQQDKYEKEHKQ